MMPEDLLKEYAPKLLSISSLNDALSDFDDNQSQLVFVYWHDKITNLLLMNISSVWGRILARVTDQLNASGVPMEDVLDAVGEKFAGTIVRSRHGVEAPEADKDKEDQGSGTYGGGG